MSLNLWDVYRYNALEANYNAVCAERDDLLHNEQTLKRELFELKNAYDQIKENEEDEEYVGNRTKALKLSFELEDTKMELIDTACKLSRAEIKVNSLEDQIKSMTAELQSRMQREQMLNEQLMKANWALSKQTSEKSGLQSRFDMINSKNDTLSKQVSELSSKLVEVEHKYEDSIEQQRDLKSESRRYHIQLLAAKSNYKELSELYDKQNEAMESQAQDQRRTILSLEENVFRLEYENKQLKARQSTANAAAATASEVETKSASNEKQSGNTTEELLFKRNDDILDQYSVLLHQKHANMSTIQKLQNENEKLEKNAHKLQTAFNYKTSEYNNLQEAYTRLQSIEPSDEFKKLQKENTFLSRQARGLFTHIHRMASQNNTEQDAQTNVITGSDTDENTAAFISDRVASTSPPSTAQQQQSETEITTSLLKVKDCQRQTEDVIKERTFKQPTNSLQANLNTTETESTGLGGIVNTNEQHEVNDRSVKASVKRGNVKTNKLIGDKVIVQGTLSKLPINTVTPPVIRPPALVPATPGGPVARRKRTQEEREVNDDEKVTKKNKKNEMKK